MKALLTFRTFKWVLVATNSLTMLAGLILLGLGVTGLIAYEEALGATAPYVFGGLTGIGFFACILSTLGILAAVKEHIRSLKAFFVLLLIVFILQSIYGLIALGNLNESENEIVKVWQMSNNKTIVYLEARFKCCGLRNATDFAVPPDCSTSPQFGYQEGCLKKAIDSAKGNIAAIGSAAIVLSLFELVGLISSMVLFIRLTKEALAGADDFAIGGKYIGGTI